MPAHGLELVLSTHDESGSKKRLVIHTIMEYFLIAAILFIVGGLLYYQFYFEDLASRIGPFEFIPYMLFIFGFVVLILGIRNLKQTENIKVDNYGITITKGGKIKTAPWSNVIEVRSWRTFYPTAGYRTVGIREVEQVVVNTNDWKYKIKVGNFTRDELKELFTCIADYGQEHPIKVIDALDWLPGDMQFQDIKTSGRSIRIREYKILLKVGLGMLLIGALLILPVFVFNLFNSPWFAIAAMLLFFGCMLSIAGSCGISEEKKKLKNT